MLGGVFTRFAQFWLGSLGFEVFASVVAIYSFDVYEPSWGRANSLQVSIWVGLALATISATGFAIGMRIFRTSPTRLWCVLSGAITAMVLLVATQFSRAFLQPDAPDNAVVLLGALLLALGAAYFAKGGITPD